MSNPTAHDARRLAKRDDKKGVIILHVGQDNMIGYASYGRDRAHCKHMRRLADKLLDSISLEDVDPETL